MALREAVLASPAVERLVAHGGALVAPVSPQVVSPPQRLCEFLAAVAPNEADRVRFSALAPGRRLDVL
jgi:hypothetical protein